MFWENNVIKKYDEIKKFYMKWKTLSICKYLSPMVYGVYIKKDITVERNHVKSTMLIT